MDLDFILTAASAKKITSALPQTLEFYLHRLRSKYWGRMLEQSTYLDMDVRIRPFTFSGGKLLLMDGYPGVSVRIEEQRKEQTFFPIGGMLLTGNPGIGAHRSPSIKFCSKPVFVNRQNLMPLVSSYCIFVPPGACPILLRRHHLCLHSLRRLHARHRERPCSSSKIAGRTSMSS